VATRPIARWLRVLRCCPSATPLLLILLRRQSDRQRLAVPLSASASRRAIFHRDFADPAPQWDRIDRQMLAPQRPWSSDQVDFSAKDLGALIARRKSSTSSRPRSPTHQSQFIALQQGDHPLELAFDGPAPPYAPRRTQLTSMPNDPGPISTNFSSRPIDRRQSAASGTGDRATSPPCRSRRSRISRATDNAASQALLSRARPANG